MNRRDAENAEPRRENTWTAGTPRSAAECDSIAGPARLSMVVIREFQREDFESAYRLDQSCYEPGIAYSRFALAEFLSLPGAAAWVSEEESQLAPPTAGLSGFIIVRQMGRGRGHVITLDVREEKRRRGVGSRLLATAEDWLRKRGVRRVRLETAVTNEAALAFWQRAGFEATAVLPRYYLGREDAYRMEKELG